MVDLNNMINMMNFEALATIGLGPAMRGQLACGVADPDARLMRLVEVQRAQWLLHDGKGIHTADCAPALAHDLRAQGESLTVGDWLLACPGGALGWRISCRLLPHSQITRRVNDGRCSDDRPGGQRQALVSNVDTALLVMGLDADFNLRRLERYFALVRLARVAVVLVLSKADTLDAAPCAQRVAQARAVLPADVAVLALDVRQPSAAVALAPWLDRGQTLALLGSSGAGKSTLANTLLAAFAGAGQRATGPARADDSRGRHTTTARTLLPLPGAACLIDTPGLRALQLDVAGEADLGRVFGDVALWAAHCRFRNCRHLAEPGCAVRQALPEPRLLNFQKLLRESGRDGLRLTQRRALRAEWKLRSRHAALRLQVKRESGG